MSEQFRHRNRGIFQKEKGLPLLDDTSVAQEIEHARSIRTFIESTFPNPSILEQRIRPSMLLYAYNTSISYPHSTPEEHAAFLTRACTRMHSKLLHAEQHATHPQNPIPPIGIELEIEEGWHRQNRNDRTEHILDALGIESERMREWRPKTDQLEINPTFSYSAATQARLLHEIAVLGAIRIQNGKRITTRTVNPSDMYSLHINFGISRQLYWPTRMNTYLQKSPLTLLNTLIGTAFSSNERLRHRKTNDSIHVLEMHVEPEPIKQSHGRIELRAGEYRDFPTYRMLHESQLLVALGLAAEKRSEQLPCSPCETELANLWDTFLREPTVAQHAQFLQSNSLDTPFRDTLLASITPDMRTAFRSLITRYAQHCARILAAYTKNAHHRSGTR